MTTVATDPTIDPTHAIADEYTKELDLIETALERFTTFVGSVFDGPDDAHKLGRCLAFAMAAADRQTLNGVIRESYGQIREDQFRRRFAAAEKFASLGVGSLASRARATIIGLAQSGATCTTWPVFRVDDFSEVKRRADFKYVGLVSGEEKDNEPVPHVAELFALWSSLRQDHPFRNAFAADELIPLKWGDAIALTDNKFDRLNIFELEDVRRLTAQARAQAIRQQQEEAEAAEQARIAAEEEFRNSPAGKIAALESQVAELQRQLAAKT